MMEGRMQVSCLISQALAFEESNSCLDEENCFLNDSRSRRRMGTRIGRLVVWKKSDVDEGMASVSVSQGNVRYASKQSEGILFLIACSTAKMAVRARDPSSENSSWKGGRLLVCTIKPSPSFKSSKSELPPSVLEALPQMYQVCFT